MEVDDEVVIDLDLGALGAAVDGLRAGLRHRLGGSGLAARGRGGARQVENASYGIVENGGGFLGTEEAVASVLILGRGDGS